MPFPAVAQALSRLARAGTIEHLSKGLYYRPRQTALGKSRPNPAAISRLAAHRKTMFPSGTTAANLLGFTTQNPKRAEIATTELSLPRKLLGADAIVHTGARRNGRSSPSPMLHFSISFATEASQVSCLRMKRSARRLLSWRRKVGSSGC